MKLFSLSKRCGKMALVVLTALVLPSLACAQQMLTLKPAPASRDSHVTVGDVFDNAGPLAGVVVGYRTGDTVILDAATVQSVVGANGGYWANPRGQRRILVTAAGAGTRTAAPPAVEVTAPLPPANPFGDAPATAGGVASANPFGATAASAPVRTVAAAAPRRADIVVHRTDTIDVTWSAGGLSLTMTGVAQKDAAVGDTVAVQNPTSKKMIDALIIGPGHGIAGPGADSYRALQLSSR
jgi:flagella basal body P-ring formation protein FlgA